jgi:hypothetical protein
MGPMVYLRSFDPAPPVRYSTMETLRPLGVTFNLHLGESRAGTHGRGRSTRCKFFNA